MKTSNYLDEAKKELKIATDNELARKLNWNKSQVNNYRHNRNPMDNKQALQVAEVIGVPVWQVIADMEIQRAERADNAALRNKWSKLRKMSKQTGRATANLLIPLSFLAYGFQHYILC